VIDADTVQPMTADGAQLLDDLRQVLTRYVVFADGHTASAVALWIATTHALPAFECAPRLIVTSPEKRCGKSRLLDIISGTCHRPLVSVNATVAAIFRSIGDGHPPTLIIDEADTIFGNKKVAEHHEDLRALLNAGHQRGRPALRCVGASQIPTEFSTFAMAAIAGIGAMPDTITDRGINGTMRRRTAGERVSQFRSRRDGPILDAVRERLAAWAAEELEMLAKAEPAMPVEDRAADTWEPLIAIADAVGGHWPATARAACKAMVDQAGDADEEQSLAVKLLADIKGVFADYHVSFLSSGDLIAELRRIEDSPWDDFDYNPSKLAFRLKDFGIKPGRNPAGNVRGYSLEALSDVFERYLRQTPSDPSETTDEQESLSDGSDPSDTLDRQTRFTRQTESAAQRMFSDDLTGSDAPTAENGSSAPNADGPAPATPDQNAAYLAGLCCDCGKRKPSAGRPRCDECHRIHTNIVAGYE
jgi:hypothetical protein